MLSKDLCPHQYRLPAKQPGVVFCAQCGELLVESELVPKTKRPLVMPLLHIDITDRWWRKHSPWNKVPVALAYKYGWYLSYFLGGWHLVMPIKRGGKDVFYSARRLTGEGQKYNYPEGVDKHVFVSGKVGKVVVVTEGVADAAYVSQIASSIALLGSYYLSELEALIPSGTTIITMFDGDVAGIAASIAFKEEALKYGQWMKWRVVDAGLRDDHDPTDISLANIKRIIQKAMK